MTDKNPYDLSENDIEAINTLRDCQAYFENFLSNIRDKSSDDVKNLIDKASVDFDKGFMTLMYAATKPNN